MLTDLTSNFQHALRGVGDGRGHADRGIASFPEVSRLTQALRFLQLSFAPWVFTQALCWRPLSPFARSLSLEAAGVVASAVKLVDGLTVFTVPRQSAFHQGSLFRVSAELDGTGREHKDGMSMSNN